MAEKDLAGGYQAYTDAEELAFDGTDVTDAPTSPFGPISPVVVTAAVGC